MFAAALFPPPQVIEAAPLTRIPPALSAPRASAWAQANRGAERIGCFLEGPAFDREGHLYVTDIPFGRILRIDARLRWEVALEYDGWPNGIAIHRDGALWIADYRRGLLRWRPGDAAPTAVLDHNNTESFKGLNDLAFDRTGACLFTDQGQSGMHDPSGRVYRLAADGRLEVLLQGIPSPNGLALDLREQALFVAVTRANTVWRVPLPGGRASKAGVFRHFFGPGGPDGLAMDTAGRLVVAHASLGCALVLAPSGAVSHIVRGPQGCVITNVAFRPGGSELVMTDSESGTLLHATLPDPGAPLWSHAE